MKLCKSQNAKGDASARSVERSFPPPLFVGLSLAHVFSRLTSLTIIHRACSQAIDWTTSIRLS